MFTSWPGNVFIDVDVAEWIGSVKINRGLLCTNIRTHTLNNFNSIKRKARAEREMAIEIEIARGKEPFFFLYGIDEKNNPFVIYTSLILDPF